MNELPNGWARASIADTGQYINGLAFKPTDWEESGTPIIRIRNLTDSTAPINRTNRVVPASIKVTTGTILVSWSATLDAFIWDREDAVLNQHIFKVVPDENVVWKSFLYFLLRSEIAAMRASEHLHGSTMKHINRGPFLAHKISLPPLVEQKRIADKLEAVLGRVDACRARLDRVPDLLKRFRQSVLAAATSGQLTEDWREENGKADEWKNVQVREIADEIFDGPFGSHLKTDDYTEAGVRVVRLENIGSLRFFEDKQTFISPAKYKTLTRHTLKEYDVIFSSFISEEIRVSLLPKSWSGKAINKSDCFCVRADHGKCLPKFLAFRLACRSTFVVLGADIHGATRPRINLGQLKEYSFELPSFPEQQEIVRRVEALFAFADRIETRLTEARAQVERLTPATLAKAFRGELVPQDPSDEPAILSLNRIRKKRHSDAKLIRKFLPSRFKQCSVLNKSKFTSDHPIG